MIIPESCRELAAIQVSQWPGDPNAFDRITNAQIGAFVEKIDKPRRVIDLGCGLGRVSCGLHRHWQDDSIEYILADGDRFDGEPRTGWDPGEEWYNHLNLTHEFCTANGLENFRCHDLLKGPPTEEADLTVSLLAVGFHWPLGEWVHRPLATEQMVFGCRAGKYSTADFTSYFLRTFNDAEVVPGFCEKEEILILKGLR